MMKKQTVILIIAGLTSIAILFFVFMGRDIRATPQVDANNALVVSLKSDKVILEEKADQAVPIASLTKLMTAYLVLEAIHNKTISWDDMVSLERLDDPRAVSLYALSGKKYYSVQDLFAAMMIMSANDGAQSLGAHLDGEHFTEKMMQKAREIGMSKKTNFSSASGLDVDGKESMSTASDLMILTKKLISDYPEILDITSRTKYVTQSDDTIHTTNQVLQDGGVQGMDGFKTGYTDQAGYCMIATAVQNEDRIISITLGSKTDEDRIKATETMMDYGFSK